jgi:hypothetical protein
MQHTFNKDILRVPENLVLWASRYECVDEVAMLFLFKRIYRSGHYHSMKVPKELGITRPTFRKYLKIFYDNNWVRKRESGFIFLSMRNIQKQIYEVGTEYCFNKFITLKNYKNKFDLKTQLRWIVLHHKYDQIKYAQTCKDKGIHYSELRKLPKTLKKLVMAASTKVQMSVFQIGDSFNRSKSTGYRVKTDLERMRMLRAKPQDVKIYKKNVSVEEWYQFQSTRTYSMKDYNYSRTDEYRNGIIFENRPDLIYLMNPAIKETPFALNNTVSHFFTQFQSR